MSDDCPIDTTLLREKLERLPKGSTCQDWKEAPAKSGYWRDDTDSVTRCAKWDTSGKGRTEPPTDDSDRDDPPSKDGGGRDSKPSYRDDEGNFTDDRMKNAFYWTAQLRGWMIEGPHAGIGGTYCVEIQAGKPIVVLDKPEWGESKVKALIDSMRDYDFPRTTTKELDDEFRVFVEPSSDRPTSDYADKWKHIDPTCTDEHPDRKGDGDKDSGKGGPDVPESVGPFELNDTDFSDGFKAEYAAQGYWNGYPASLPTDEKLTITVTILDHGGKKSFKSSADVRYWIGDRDGTPDEQSRIGTRRKRDNPQVAFVNALGIAVEWMEENPPADEPEDKGVEPEDPPEEVAGWEIKRELEDQIDYSAEYYETGFPSHEIDPAEELAEVVLTVMDTSSRKFPNRWTARVIHWDTDDKDQHNSDILSSVTYDDPVKNRNQALRAAIEWMKKHPTAEKPEPESEDEDEQEDDSPADWPEFEISIENGRLREMTEPFKRFGRSNGGSHFTVDPDGAIDFIGMNGDSTLMYETSLLLSNAESASIGNAGETVRFDADFFASTVADTNMSEPATIRAEDGELTYESDGFSKSFELEATEQGMPSFPSPDIGVTVSGIETNKFKKSVRGLSKINSDSIAVVAESDEFYMVTENDEGDRARANLTSTKSDITLPSDGMDRYSVLFGYSYLRQVSLSPYAPASTDLRFELYRLKGEEFEEGNYTSTPMNVSYEQRGGVVRYTIAPRMVTDKANKNADEWDLSSPAEPESECPIASTDGGLTLSEPLESGDEVPDVDGMNLHEGDSVIWTFPKADGCRCGAQALQYEQLADELDVPVYGIAATSPEDLNDMAERYDLTFTLISDPEGQLASEFGVELSDGKLERQTMFVRDGRITDVSDGVAPPELSQPDGNECPIKSVSEPLTLAQKNEKTLYDSIEHPSVYVITGSRGSGKSALAHRLGEQMAEREDIVPVAVGVPEHIQEKYPSQWVHVDDMDEAPGDSIVIIDEAYLKFHARQSQKKENLKMGAYVNTSRHCNRTIVFVSQNSGHLDKMAVSEADGLMIKEPGTFHMEFERAQLRDITERAKDSYDQLPGNLDNREYVYAVSDNFEGLVENDQPEWYGDEVSKSYGAACQPAEPEAESADD